MSASYTNDEPGVAAGLQIEQDFTNSTTAARAARADCCRGIGEVLFNLEPGGNAGLFVCV